jgi:AraC-like DNA-binding protein
MRSVTRVASGCGFSIDDVRICADRTSWLGPDVAGAYQLVFVRTGVFRLRVRDWEILADPLVAYVSRPGTEQQIAHQIGATDACTVVTLSAALFHEIAGDDTRCASQPLRTSAHIDLSHRVLLARARTCEDGFELQERVHRLAADVLQPGPRYTIRSRRLVDAARELIVDDPVSLSLTGLAAKLGTSPHHLSRVFHAEVGETISRYRNRIRVRRVLDRIDAGEHSLARLAAELGFSDHAHLTRVVRTELGCPPTAVRQLFSP